MIEIILALGVVVLGTLAISGRRPLSQTGPAFDLAGSVAFDDDPGDLPCPWCLAPTREQDPRCPSCGQRFG